MGTTSYGVVLAILKCVCVGGGGGGEVSAL